MVLLPDVVHHGVGVLGEVGLEETALRIPNLSLLRPHPEVEHILLRVDARHEVVISGHLAEGKADLHLARAAVADAEGLRP